MEKPNSFSFVARNFISYSEALLERVKYSYDSTTSPFNRGNLIDNFCIECVFIQGHTSLECHGCICTFSVFRANLDKPFIEAFHGVQNFQHLEGLLRRQQDS